MHSASKCTLTYLSEMPKPSVKCPGLSGLLITCQAMLLFAKNAHILGRPSAACLGPETAGMSQEPSRSGPAHSADTAAHQDLEDPKRFFLGRGKLA